MRSLFFSRTRLLLKLTTESLVCAFEHKALSSWVSAFDFMPGKEHIFLQRLSQSNDMQVCSLNELDLNRLLHYPQYCRLFYNSFGSELFKQQNFDLYLSIAIDYGLQESETVQDMVRWLLCSYIESRTYNDIKLRHLDNIYARTQKLWVNIAFFLKLPLSYRPSIQVLAKNVPFNDFETYYSNLLIGQVFRKSANSALKLWITDDSIPDRLQKFRWLIAKIDISLESLNTFFVYSIDSRQFAFAHCLVAKNIKCVGSYLDLFVRYLIEDGDARTLDLFLKDCLKSLAPSSHRVYQWMYWSQVSEQLDCTEVIKSNFICNFKALPIYHEQFQSYLSKKLYQTRIEAISAPTICNLAIRAKHQVLANLKLPEEGFRYQSLLNLVKIFLHLGLKVKQAREVYDHNKSIFNIDSSHLRIVRIVTPEFFFYLENSALTIYEWHQFLIGLELVAQQFPQDIHAVLSSFAVALNSKDLINFVIYLECGKNSKLHVFAKANPYKLDFTYYSLQSYISAFASTCSTPPVDFIATENKRANSLVINFQSVFPIADNTCMMAIDVCADVFQFKAKQFYLRSYHQDSHQILPLKVDYLITETELVAAGAEELSSILAEASLAKRFLRAMYFAGCKMYEQNHNYQKVERYYTDLQFSVDWAIELEVDYDVVDFDNPHVKSSKVQVKTTSDFNYVDSSQCLSLGEYGDFIVQCTAEAETSDPYVIEYTSRSLVHPVSFVEGALNHRQLSFFNRLKLACEVWSDSANITQCGQVFS